ncbi:insulin-like growth factor 2 mRNA-binding protein 1 [Caerostris extrusa]|uniref:Insulin-like growth factor 2 mRNA-binding protein 1 n=1 Tax=Caerostris extrusa TaxID=172846 RepID=A0AAV4XVV6_CAEEX|nr:insulin-like growth factor 2 mRNA-binding protein 1 [Caerostris extrusa]
MTFDKVAPLGRRHEGNFREFPGNFPHHRPDPAFDSHWNNRQPWLRNMPGAIQRNSSERWNHDRNNRNRTNKLQISNIFANAPWDDVKELLGTFGSILQCERGSGKTEDFCCAYITYETQDQAQQAYTQLNGFDFEGNPLKVDYIMDRGPGSRSPRGGVGRGVLSDMVGAIIGRSGGTIRQITQQSRARVDVHRKENSGAFDKDEMYSVQVITIYGNPDNCSLACQKILEVMQQEANNTNRGEVPLKILAHNNLIGRIIGKSGNTIKRIMETTETKITVSSSMQDVNTFNFERVITIKGKLENICKAEQMISSKLRQSYENDLAAMAPAAMMFPGLHPMAMMSTVSNTGYPGRGGPIPPPPPPPSYGGGMYGNPPPYNVPMMYSPNAPPPSQNLEPSKETVYLYIPNAAVGAIIGTGGSTIRDMISSSGASIKVAQTNKEEPIDREALRKVTIVGTAEAQWKAQYMIFKKVTFETYTGAQDSHFLKVEIFVPSNQVGRIIGKGGQTVRELQRQTHAIIKLPEENDNAENDETPVHIIGDFYSTQAAQRQIRALVNKSQMTGLRRPPGGLPPNQRQVQVN